MIRMPDQDWLRDWDDFGCPKAYPKACAKMQSGRVDW
jgi:hypothetical protein